MPLGLSQLPLTTPAWEKSPRRPLLARPYQLLRTDRQTTRGRAAPRPYRSGVINRPSRRSVEMGPKQGPNRRHRAAPRACRKMSTVAIASPRSQPPISDRSDQLHAQFPSDAGRERATGLGPPACLERAHGRNEQTVTHPSGRRWHAFARWTNPASGRQCSPESRRERQAERLDAAIQPSERRLGLP
jgi:hypothetical protein